MSERKVLNKYFPPNFDPSKIPRRKKDKNSGPKKHKVRLMAPFSMQCNTCGEYIYKGKKFNANKETVEGETYLSIKIFRFYIRCPKCHAEITFKTDPANIDYVAESGAVRNFEPWRDQEAVDTQSKSLRALDEELNPMRALENKTDDAKREMELMDLLDEVRTRNARIDAVSEDAAIDRLVAMAAQSEQEVEEEFDRLAREAFRGAAAAGKSRAKSRNEDGVPLDHSDSDGDGGDDSVEEEVDLTELLNEYRGAAPDSRASAGRSFAGASSSSALVDEPDPAAAASSRKRKNMWADLVVKKMPPVQSTLVSAGAPGAAAHAAPSRPGALAPVVAAQSGALSTPKSVAPPASAAPRPAAGKKSMLVIQYQSDDDSD
ncbi:hypothetical protein AMAG_06229 [Allomyces macrogynus ATCC 38327]|uniref:Splicing factor YJU2 n=1 Tax=Allomyces macrogynus (strain ATCC 38327) TaxID=578462 RepID=A0A0L0SG26_ALLM3|nr:hypothetical protein AMAG_06229 [Allomyces macrogynus ATCC 38327]|eukprot:KNE61399.1 hypothetical protein AMAG_06229 [Allomyces macrogynus ATCC 38327]